MFLSILNSALYVRDKLQEVQCEPLVVELDTELRQQLVAGDAPSLVDVFMSRRSTDMSLLGEAAIQTVTDVASSISRYSCFAYVCFESLTFAACLLFSASGKVKKTLSSNRAMRGFEMLGISVVARTLLATTAEEESDTSEPATAALRSSSDAPSDHEAFAAAAASCRVLEPSLAGARSCASGV